MHSGVYLSPEHWQSVEQLLEPGESVMWADQPEPHFFTGFTTFSFFAGLIWIVMVVLLLVSNTISFSLTDFSTLQNFTYLVIVLFCLSIGLPLLLMPVMEHHLLVGTIYVLTDARAVIITSIRKMRYKTYPLEKITRVNCEQKYENVGHIIFVSGVKYFGLPGRNGGPGFYYIRGAERVAGIFEKLISDQDAAVENIYPHIVEKSKRKNWVIELAIRLLEAAAVGLLLTTVFGFPAALAWVTDTGAPGYMFFFLLFVLECQLRTMYFAGHSTRWPTTTGSVTESYVLSDDEGHRPRVQYNYRVGKKEYSNNDITYRQISDVLNKGPAEAIVAQYPVGRNVTVYYHPRTPIYAVLEPGSGGGNWFAFTIIMACFIATTAWVANTWNGISYEALILKWQQTVKLIISYATIIQENIRQIIL